MAVMTFDLKHGYKVGESTHLEVGLRELTPKDVFDAQMASEHVTVIDGRPYAYVSNAQFGMELLCRQVEYIGAIQGPFMTKELLKLESEDFETIQRKAEELDKMMIPQEVLDGIEQRGEN
jgi:phage FluMu protein gp41